MKQSTSTEKTNLTIDGEVSESSNPFYIVYGGGNSGGNSNSDTRNTPKKPQRIKLLTLLFENEKPDKCCYNRSVLGFPLHKLAKRHNVWLETKHLKLLLMRHSAKL